ncbi:MAG: hypothetical protein PHE36_01445 [Novosphingobium sp.]|nr:hypothetical protein [Novosphingobium sp.]
MPDKFPTISIGQRSPHLRVDARSGAEDTPMTPLETASRAFCAHMGINPDEIVAMVGTPHRPAWQAYAPAVRAALLAIMPPTKEMEEAAEDARPFNGGLEYHEMLETSPEAIWQAMLDAVAGEDE